ncbi:peptide chain release factor N(5)-glutamine methyltransferase [Clostridium luticellarii]|jgi:release factor glutamine methyltransferase|uniref:peptide chain release factor N(5)-glutamine methyltransferase n=1 Tax=Clostridium luticellarii TaxID=1691940 RepID=UPI002353D79E|nr:peptide chain release factor N(5)-glutamine methyltransferase [Clostridium luticellarii]MCI1945294.1 peptide chain release factor N(5)-glutamine methyltransferase [Clostridium luticellarii]MCI1968645.1 peptide chain release factor N(5)-glutamine methyltransferase [Clostridium luticellarii]
MGNKINELLKYGYELLKKQKINSYILDVQLLLGKAINKDRLFLFINGDYEITEEEAENYYGYLKLREKKMPVKYILGECEFMGLNFKVRPGVLIPRPDTEILVECALKEIERSNFSDICDLCCGTGAIGLSIAKFIDYVDVKCSDISPTALQVTAENMRRFLLQEKVQVIKSDLLQYFIENEMKFNMVVSNPPYIKISMIDTLMDDVKNYEPYEALCGGEDGLEFYRRIAVESLKVLEDDGVIMLEIGDDERDSVSSILRESGFENICCIKDLSGKDRVISAVVGTHSLI